MSWWLIGVGSRVFKVGEAGELCRLITALVNLGAD
jgi:hypothetical protein